MKTTLLLAFTIVTSLNFIAQNEEDILRYSYTNLQGSARYAAMGGAFGALGADLTVASTNPAGLARFKHSNGMLTTNLKIDKTTSSLNQTEQTSTLENLGIENIGYVGVFNEDNGSRWIKFQFGVTYNRLANFNNKMQIKGENNASYSYVLAARGYGLTPDELSAYDYHYANMAYGSYLIDPVFDSTIYYTTQMYGDNITQEHTKETWGRLGETSIAFSGNYLDKIYVGASVGITKIKFGQTRTHYEKNNTDSLPISHFTFIENLTTEGNGLNLKLGAILLPQPWLRIGLAYHTATRYNNMTDRWNTEISTVFKGDSSYYEKSLYSSYTYAMQTPGRTMISLAYINKKYGIISVDAEYTNYGKGQLLPHRQSTDNYQFEYENTTAQTLFRKTLDLRVGAEYRISSNLMARLGYAVRTTPLKEEYREKATNQTSISGGIGFRTNIFYADLAIIHTQRKDNYYMYDPVLVENSNPQLKSLNTMLTIGARF